jgi:hypothetical protein
MGCEEPAKPAPSAPSAAAVEPAPPPPAPKRAPRLAIDEISPLVGFTRAVLFDDAGKPNPEGKAQLAAELSAVREFLEGKELVVEVDRKVKPEWVTLFLDALAVHRPSRIAVRTETRSDYPKDVAFVPEAQAGTLPSCTLVGAITEDRGTAVWRLSGGTARKRGRGMGGPDLTMAGDTIVSMAKGCDSDLFVVSGAEGVEWGLVYDLAASAQTLEKAALRRALLPAERPTAGRPVTLAR